MWRRLLAGDDRRRAADALDAISADLVALSADPDFAPAPDGLTCGRAGVAVFLAYHARATGRDREASAAVELLAASILGAMRRPPGLSLSEGLVGVAWAVSHLRRTALPDRYEDPVAAVDGAVADLLADDDWPVDGELLHGLAGYGICALERLPGPTPVAVLEGIVARLARSAVRQDGGVTWRAAAGDPDGRIDLGVAHGVAGIIGFLARVAAAGVSEVAARELLAPATDWLLARRTDGFGGTTVPPFLGYELRAAQARTAWCYGDLGVAAALLAAARYAHRADWERAAVAMARAAAARPRDRMHLLGTGLCHGTAGAAHLFGRMHQATGDPELRAAALRWFGHVLDDRRPGTGVGGFGAYHAEPGGTPRWWGDPGLLDGAAGVGLALLSALEPVEPEWDRALAVAVPARG